MLLRKTYSQTATPTTPFERRQAIHQQMSLTENNVGIDSLQFSTLNALTADSLEIPVFSSRPMKFHHIFDHKPSNFVQWRPIETEFGGDCTNFIPSVLETGAIDVDRSSSKSICSSIMTAGDSLKKRKSEVAVAENYKDDKLERETGEEDSEITAKSPNETSMDALKENSKVSESKKTDYIHVRARRGQATDSHSIAERARREKISKKMKCLQDLVPGCNKATGKAGMLEEIINYVQSLQNQVEFLSMKLANSNPRQESNTDNLFVKEFPAFMARFQASYAPSEMANLSHLLNINQGGTSSFGTDMVHQNIASSSMSNSEAYLDLPAQPLPAWGSDLQSLYCTEFQ